jgi:hypothetical protein
MRRSLPTWTPEAFRGEIAGFDGAKTTCGSFIVNHVLGQCAAYDAAVPVPESLRPRGIEHGEPVGRRRSTGPCVDMEFKFDTALPVLTRTPSVLADLLADLPSSWTDAVEGPNTWSPFDVVGHLIHGERTDRVPRIEHLLRHSDAIPFPPFDREAMFAASQGKSLASCSTPSPGCERTASIDWLRSASATRICAAAGTRVRRRDAGTAPLDLGGTRPGPHQPDRPCHGAPAH